MQELRNMTNIPEGFSRQYSLNETDKVENKDDSLLFQPKKGLLLREQVKQESD